MEKAHKSPPRVKSVVRAYGKAALKHPWVLFLVVAGVLIIQAASVAGPLFLKEFVDALSSPARETVRPLVAILGLYALVRIGDWIGQRIRLAGVNRMESQAMEHLYNEAFTYLISHSHDFFISNFTGTLTRRVTRYARAFEQVFDNLVFNLLPAFLFAIGVIIVLSQRSAYMGAGLLAWTVLYVYFQYWVVRRLQPLRTARTEADSALTGTLSDAISNHSSVAVFAAERREQTVFGGMVRAWRNATKRTWDADAWRLALQGFLALTIELGLFVAALYLWQQGLLTVGDFVLIQVYIVGLLHMIWNVGNNMRQLYDAFSEATEMLDIMELPHAIADVPHAKALSVKGGEITFDKVRFKYGDGRLVLDDFALAIASKEKVAFVGASGAGKSTIAKLLLRLYEITDGEIRIDGQDIAQVTQESLRRAIALVPQEPALFHRTLMENIRYGRPEATDEEVYDAARQAHCYEFIAQYPEGFATMVGERGVKLSGGERQRVAIARAILKNAPILILDEATSSLDSESEAFIQDALSRLMEGKTVIAIAHRLSTVMKMDRIIVVEEGHVVLTGSHDELLVHESNLYKKLWEIQAGGFMRAELTEEAAA